MGIYAWHLTALSLCAAAIAAGLWAPHRFSTGWWLSRPVWFAAVLGLTGALVAITAAARRARSRRGRGARRDERSAARTWSRASSAAPSARV